MHQNFKKAVLRRQGKPVEDIIGLQEEEEVEDLINSDEEEPEDDVVVERLIWYFSSSHSAFVSAQQLNDAWLSFMIQ